MKAIRVFDLVWTVGENSSESVRKRFSVDEAEIFTPL